MRRRPATQGGKMGRRSARQAGKMLCYRASLITPPPHAGDGPGERGSTAPYDALILAVAHRDFIDLGAAQQAQIGILGLGYVGLPLMPRYAEVGYLPGSAGLA